MTEHERNHLLRMVKHAEKVRRNMDNLRATNPVTPKELEKIKSRDVQTYSCPVCGDDVTAHDSAHSVKCRSCATRLRVDRDAQFEGGAWHDLTRLVPI